MTYAFDLIELEKFHASVIYNMIIYAISDERK